MVPTEKQHELGLHSVKLKVYHAPTPAHYGKQEEHLQFRKMCVHLCIINNLMKKTLTLFLLLSTTHNRTR